MRLLCAYVIIIAYNAYNARYYDIGSPIRGELGPTDAYNGPGMRDYWSFRTNYYTDVGYHRHF